MERARSLIEAYIDRGISVAVGVSGGMDSMCLLHFLLSVECVSRERLIVVNVEHGIRGEKSRADSEFVRGFASRHNLKCIGIDVDVPKRAKASGRSVEHEARIARHEAYCKALESGADLILTAHHADDNAETVLMNIFRGASLNGIKGIELFGSMTVFDKVFSNKLFRPFINCTRAQLCDYAKTHDVEYVEDLTNLDSSYSRNFVRNEILPLIKTKWSGAVESINRLSFDARTALDIINDEIVLENSANKNEVKIPEAALLSPSASYYVFAALKKLDVYCDFESKHVALVIALANKGLNGRVDLPQNITAFRDVGGVTLSKNCLVTNASTDFVAFKLGEIAIGDKTIVVERVSDFNTESLKQNKDLFFDIDKLPSDAVIRFRRDGDIFAPFKCGTKKLKEYLIDKKIPSRLRGGIPLLASNNRILAVIGVEIADGIKIEKGSCSIARIGLKN